MFVGIGVGVGRQRFAGDFVGSYSKRVLSDRGVIESLTCVAGTSALLKQASFLLIPSGYKENVVYAQKPTNGNGDLTWTRASDGFRTFSDGTIRRTPFNITTNSENFTTGWAKSFVTTTVSGTSPNGLSNATLVSVGVDASSIRHRIYNNVTTTFLVGVTYTYSIYAKKNAHSWIQLMFGNGSPISPYPNVFTTLAFANFNLETGTTGNVGAGTIATITDEKNGWYRISITCTAVGSGVATAEIIVTNNTNSARYVSYQSSVAEDVFYIWGAQLNEGSLTPYILNTDRQDVARLSYMYGTCPALLLEPQRTNLFRWSEDFNLFTTPIWTKSTSTTSTSNQTTSPNGLNNGTLFAGDGTAGIKGLSQTLNVSNNTVYTVSIYAKRATNNFIQIAASSGFFASNAYANFDLSTGVVGTVSNATSSIQSVGNGWYRCIMTATSTATSGAVGFYLIDSATAGRAPSNSLNTGVFIWGAQFEYGITISTPANYATTYIPNTSAVSGTTRNADTFTRNNIRTNELITASGGTWFIELKNNISYTRDGLMRIGIGDSTNLLNNSIWISPDSPSGRYVILKTVGTNNTTLYGTLTDNVKIVVKWNGTNLDVFVNGNKITLNSAQRQFSVTSMENLIATAMTVPTFIQAMALFNSPKSDEFCEALTSENFDTYALMATSLGYNLL